MKIGVSIPLQNLLELIQLKTTPLAQVVTPARHIRALFKIVVYLGTMRLFSSLFLSKPARLLQQTKRYAKKFKKNCFQSGENGFRV